MSKHRPERCIDCAYLTRSTSDPDDTRKHCFVNPVPRSGRSPICRSFVKRVERTKE